MGLLPAPPARPRPHLSGSLLRPQRRFRGYSCRTVPSGPTPPTPPPASPPLLGPGSKKVLGWADSGGNSIEFSFGYILKAKVSWTYSQTDRDEEGRGAMLGLEKEAALLSPSTPRNTCLSGVAVPQSPLSHPPQHQTEGEAPSPRGCSPPQPGLYIQWFSAVLWLRGPQRGRWPVSLGWTVAVTRVCWPILGPTVCAICFSEGWYTTLPKPPPNQKHLPKNQKLKTGSFQLAL